MNLRQVFPTDSPLVTQIESALDHWYPILLGYRFNHVIAPKPSSISAEITTDTDRLILSHIRSQSDLIITTGKTARREHLRGSKFAPLLILTTERLVAGIPALDETSTKDVFVTIEHQVEFKNTNARAVGQVTGSLPDWLQDFVASLGFKSVVVETGLTTFKELFKADILHEVCLTVSNVEQESTAIELATDFLETNNATNVALIQILNDGSAWFFRFQVLPPK